LKKNFDGGGQFKTSHQMKKTPPPEKKKQDADRYVGTGRRRTTATGRQPSESQPMIK
jgi:hypothetical protein